MGALQFFKKIGIDKPVGIRKLTRSFFGKQDGRSLIMKKLVQKFVTGMAVFALSVCLAQAQNVQQGKARVTAIKGQAQYKLTADGQWIPLKVNTILRSGAIVQAGQGSVVDLFLGENGPMVRVTESTELGLDKLTLQKTAEEVIIETELNLKAGTIRGNVKKLAAASRYEVKTPVGVCAIRGTIYQISANGVVIIDRGSATFRPSTPGQPPVNINAQQTYDPAGGVRQNPGQIIVNPPPDVPTTSTDQNPSNPPPPPPPPGGGEGVQPPEPPREPPPSPTKP